MICVTMGDAAGVGPEIILLAAEKGLLTGDYIVVGDYEVLAQCRRVIGSKVELRRIANPADRCSGSVNVLDLGLLSKDDIRVGTLNPHSGAAALAYVEKATRLALAGTAAALVTLPMNKEATRLGRPDFTGHTEFIAQLCGESGYTMMLASPKLCVTHVSTHVSMAEALSLVRRERIEKVVELTRTALARYLAAPRIAVAGLNPHAGEGGAFGREDIEEIAPAVEAGRGAGWDVVGPEAPDTVFLRASRGAFDAVVCMYHDQGHIPMKLLDFEGGVNVTLGLRVVRTSVDHGTAFDIAWQGKASTDSFVAAFEYAKKLTGEA